MGLLKQPALAERTYFGYISSSMMEAQQQQLKKSNMPWQHLDTSARGKSVGTMAHADRPDSSVSLTCRLQSTATDFQHAHFQQAKQNDRFLPSKKTRKTASPPMIPHCTLLNAVCLYKNIGKSRTAEQEGQSGQQSVQNSVKERPPFR